MRHRLAIAAAVSVLGLGVAWGGAGLAEEAGEKVLYEKGDPLKQGWKMVGPGSIREESPGVLVTEGGMGMLWFAEQPFENFTLSLEYKLTEADDNSGVFVRFPNPPKDPWVAVNEGYEIQICDGADPEHRTGSIYSFKAPESPIDARPVGEWNTYQITVKGQDYTVTHNGKVVNRYKGSRGSKGYIGIQNHDDKSIVRFRNIRVKPLEN